MTLAVLALAWAVVIAGILNADPTWNPRAIVRSVAVAAGMLLALSIGAVLSTMLT